MTETSTSLKQKPSASGQGMVAAVEPPYLLMLSTWSSGSVAGGISHSHGDGRGVEKRDFSMRFYGLWLYGYMVIWLFTLIQWFMVLWDMHNIIDDGYMMLYGYV